MPFRIVRQDLTKTECDAVVNAAVRNPVSGGNAALFRAAGPGLAEECRRIGVCEPGQAKLTGGYELPAGYVIHTVVPVWHGGILGERKKLSQCYENVLALAEQQGFSSVAFPLLCAAQGGFPKELALETARKAIGKFLLGNDMTVLLCVPDSGSFSIGSRRFSEIEAYLEDCLEEETGGGFAAPSMPQMTVMREEEASREDDFLQTAAFSAAMPSQAPADNAAPRRKKAAKRTASGKKKRAVLETQADAAVFQGSLEDMLKTLDESFSQMLLRKIDEKGMKDSECYKKANIDRKLFSKIRSDINYRPSKQTAMAFAVALELPMSEAGELLQKAGYAFSGSSKFDLIIRYFIEHREYNIFTINEALFAFDQPLLGS